MAKKKALPQLVKAHALRMTAVDVKEAPVRGKKLSEPVSKVSDTSAKKRIVAALARLHPMD